MNKIMLDFPELSSDVPQQQDFGSARTQNSYFKGALRVLPKSDSLRSLLRLSQHCLRRGKPGNGHAEG